MTERGFLIHRSPLITEIFRTKEYLQQIEEMKENLRDERPDGNSDKIRLEILRRELEESLRENEDLRLLFCTEKIRVKTKSAQAPLFFP